MWQRNLARKIKLKKKRWLSKWAVRRHFLLKKYEKNIFTFQSMYNENPYHFLKYCYLFTHKKFLKFGIIFMPAR